MNSNNPEYNKIKINTETIVYAYVTFAMYLLSQHCKMCTC